MTKNNLFKNSNCNKFPTIFSSNLMDSMFDQIGKWEDAFTSTTYPYNVKQLKNGTIIIEFALAGWQRSEINVKVLGDDLYIEATKSAEDKEKSNKDVTYLHHGLAQRSLKYTFKLGTLADKKKINCSFENGLLELTLPVLKEESFDINVD